MTSMKILLVEDDDVFIKVLTRILKAHHYAIDVVKDGEMGWTYGCTFEYDLIVLDVVLPKLDGMSLCQRFRAEGYLTPILLLTAQDTNTAKVQGLDAGADDYVVKSCDQAELVARMRALLRRGSMNPLPLLTCGDLILNQSTCEVSFQGQRLALTRKEYELLELMMRDSQHVFSTEELLEHLWSSEQFPAEATVRSHIRRVRHKLTSVGAPPDFIATLHGQGYYLKAAGTEASTPLPAAPDPDPGLARPLIHPAFEQKFPGAAQQQYLDFLNATWTTTKPNSMAQIALLLQAVRKLQEHRLSPPEQAQAQQFAHKLAGTLSIFGLHQAVHLARQLEDWLGSDPLHPQQAPLIQSLILTLQQEIQETTLIQESQLPHEFSPLVLLVGAAGDFNQALEEIALSWGIQLQGVPLQAPQVTLRAIAEIAIRAGQPPEIILLRLPPSRSQFQAPDPSWETPMLLEILQGCTQLYPDRLVGVMGDRMNFSDRLEVARRGGKLFLDHSTPPEQVIATAVQWLKGARSATKVMIVDDDEHWLRHLPTLLKPWGFKVTTLADPQQFWPVLQAITPDVLVLEVNMPQINGLELCQILRSDPQWQQLPILFLSVLNDCATQQQAFAVGADDYLCKPLMGGELAGRILNRLKRVRAWAS